MNDSQFVEASRHMGERILREAGESIDERVEFIFRLLTSRRPDSEELQVLAELYRDEAARFDANPEAAKQLLAVGQSAVPGDLEPTSLAAATVLANAVLSFDEAIVLR
jgi:hypothetical protein